jgi:hypothetical protein
MEEGVFDIPGIVGKQFDSVKEWDPIPTDGIPLLSSFILTAEWSLTHVTFSAYRAFSQLSEAAHKAWGRTRLACWLTDGGLASRRTREAALARESRAPPGPMILESVAWLEVNP